MVCSSLTSSAFASEVLYGGLGNNSTSPGGVVVINQSTGAGTVLGTPNSTGGITGLAFNSSGQLYATVSPPHGSAFLERVDPVTFAQIGGNISLISDPNIGDLAFQPGTGILYGVTNNRSGAPGTIYTIDITTGVETLVGSGVQPNFFGGGIAFSPDGKLYYASYDLNCCTLPGETGFALYTLDPTNANVLSQVPTDNTLFFDGLAVRPDGVVFANRAGVDGIYTIDPATGATTLVGSIGNSNRISDLDFQPTPEPGTSALMALGALALLAGRLKKNRCL